MKEKKDRRQAHQDFTKRLVDQSEKDTGHTPTDKQQRALEETARSEADKFDRRG